MEHANSQTETPAPVLRLRLWPAVIAVAAQLLATVLISVFGTTTLLDVWASLFGPLVTLIVLALWWLFASRAPVRDRLAGLLLFAGVIGWLLFLHRPFGFMVAVRALPVMSTGMVVMLLLCARIPWTKRRWYPAAVILACAAVFTPVRIEGMGGNLVPDLAWSWTPAFEEQAEYPHGAARRLPDAAGPKDWPAFRGPLRNGRLPGQTISADWSTPPEEVWRRPVGLGWSSFCAVGGFLFTQEQRGEDETVVCYDADTGDEVWVQAMPVYFEDIMGAGPRATPSFSDGKLYTYSVTGILQCLDAATGKVLWKVDARKETGAKPPQWGYASSPLVLDDIVLIFASGGEGKGVAAYDRETGEPAWTGGDGKHGYSSVQLSEIGGVPQLLISSNLGLQSLEPETGDLLWEHRWKTSSNPRVVQPLVLDERHVLLGTAGGQGTRRLRVEQAEGQWRVTELWTSRKFRPYFNDFIVHDGHCYGFDGNRLACIDVETGEQRWRGERCGGQLLFLEDMAMLLVLTEKGKVMLVKAEPGALEKVAEFSAIEGKTWNHPIIHEGRLYVRNSTEAACFALPV